MILQEHRKDYLSLYIPLIAVDIISFNGHNFFTWTECNGAIDLLFKAASLSLISLMEAFFLNLRCTVSNFAVYLTKILPDNCEFSIHSIL